MILRCNVWDGSVCSDRKRIGGCQGLGEGRVAVTAPGNGVSCWGDALKPKGGGGFATLRMY